MSKFREYSPEMPTEAILKIFNLRVIIGPTCFAGSLANCKCLNYVQF